MLELILLALTAVSLAAPAAEATTTYTCPNRYELVGSYGAVIVTLDEVGSVHENVIISTEVGDGWTAELEQLVEDWPCEVFTDIEPMGSQVQLQCGCRYEGSAVLQNVIETSVTRTVAATGCTYEGNLTFTCQ